MFKQKIKYGSLKNSIIVTIICIISFFSICLLSVDLISNNKKTKKYAIESSNSIASQVIRNYNTSLESMFTTFSYLEVELLNNSNYEECIEKFNIIKVSRDDIANVTLCKSDGLSIISTGYTLYQTEEEIVNNYSTPNNYCFSKPYINCGIYNIVLGKQVIYYDNFVSKTGILLIECSFQNIIDASKSIQIGSGGFLNIYSENEEIIYSNKDRLANDNIDAILKSANDLVLGTELIKQKGNYYVLYCQTISGTGWRIVIAINVNDFFNSIRIYNITLFVLGVLIIIISIIAASIVSKRVSTPLSELEKTMRDVENGNFDITSNISSGTQREIVSLNNSFNSMLNKIRSLMSEIVEEQKEKSKSELKALQNQINPHFLYNTLDSIVYMAECNRTEEVKKMVVALAKFFRISISKGKTIITVEEELEHARNYMIIQSMRYKDTFSFSINVCEECKKLPAMKLMLQPFIENSIYHGLKNLSEEGKIDINVFNDLEYLYFEIIDNGYGIKKAKIDELYENMHNKEVMNSVGIKNVYQRLKIYYGEKADIKIESELDEYTKFTIIVPLKGVES